MNPVLYQGRLKTWKDERGFGFIKPDDGSKEVFLHISALKGTSRRPQVGDTILYELATESDGKVRASNASIQGVALRPLNLPRNQSQSQVPKESRTNSSTNPLPKRHNKKNRRLVESLMKFGVITIIAIVAIKFSSSDFPSPITSVAKPGCNIKGNISINTGNKLYHLPGMEDYESTNIDTAKGERWFCTESEAIASGWNKAPR
ncbi:cold shock domain-containing protein [Allocoleopsis franciscana]|uniref:Cold shock protein n=1 Tax=Allocoleopsis franciscana PCC 7113 TaxID=1173027 RepID=K9WL04_9CYAN|nr:cold shock domain-containing protein [Allocoleopsis franciscana]AFZ20496.1 cold shock protein [Allocoleopsis franciscana PCC 7113]